jgi:hypothetical protein
MAWSQPHRLFSKFNTQLPTPNSSNAKPLTSSVSGQLALAISCLYGLVGVLHLQKWKQQENYLPS